MARLEIIRTEKNKGSGFSYTFKSEGLRATAELDPTTGESHVKFQKAQNMASALEVVVHKLQEESHAWHTSPLLMLRIDIDAGKFEKVLTEVAPRFGFSGPQRAGEFGMVEQHVRFRAELPLAG